MERKGHLLMFISRKLFIWLCLCFIFFQEILSFYYCLFAWYRNTWFYLYCSKNIMFFHIYCNWIWWWRESESTGQALNKEKINQIYQVKRETNRRILRLILGHLFHLSSQVGKIMVMVTQIKVNQIKIRWGSLKK